MKKSARSLSLLSRNENKIPKSFRRTFSFPALTEDGGTIFPFPGDVRITTSLDSFLNSSSKSDFAAGMAATCAAGPQNCVDRQTRSRSPSFLSARLRLFHVAIVRRCAILRVIRESRKIYFKHTRTPALNEFVCEGRFIIGGGTREPSSLIFAEGDDVCLLRRTYRSQSLSRKRRATGNIKAETRARACAKLRRSSNPRSRHDSGADDSHSSIGHNFP